jgi:hypothetical protein
MSQSHSRREDGFNSERMFPTCSGTACVRLLYVRSLLIQH